MKIITDSFIKRIIRQNLNESYVLLNEGNKLSECVDGGFCLGPDGKDTNWSDVKKLNNTIGVNNLNNDLIKKFKELCSNKLGKGNEDNASTLIDKIYSEVQLTNVDETKVKNLILSLGNFPTWCATIQMAGNKSYGRNFWNEDGDSNSVGSDDYSTYVVSPIVQLFRNSIKITKKHEVLYLQQQKDNLKQKEIKNNELLVNAKKCGWNNVDEYQKSGWKCDGPKFTIGGGGDNSVSFSGYECISDHPAKINQPVPLRGGVGYKLNTGNKTIDRFVYGVVKIDGIDSGAQKDISSGEQLNFDCGDQKIQWSLSNDAWSYDAVEWGGHWSAGSKIALTTDPDFEDDGKKNKSIQTEIVKGFRYNLLTEIELKLKDTGEEVGKIQKKLGLPAERNPTFGRQTLEKVINHQKTEGAKLNPPLNTTGLVDQATYDSIMAIPDPIVPSATVYTRDLTTGSKGLDVDAIQTKLNIKTGTYGPETQNAVLDYQKKYTNLEDTGIVDKTTFDHIMANTKLGTPSTFLGKKHNYKIGDWVKVNPVAASDATQLSENNGFFKIIAVDPYTIILDLDWGKSKGFTIAGGSTQKVLFGQSASEGTKTVIKKNNIDNSSSNIKTGKRIKVSSNIRTGTVEPKKQIDVRNKEFCDTLRQVKQYINDKKGGDLTVNCKKTQKTLNQIMMALTGGTITDPNKVQTIQPIQPPGNSTTIF